MKKNIYKFVISIVIINSIICMGRVYATNYTEKKEITKEQQAIIDVANAFYYRGAAIQYDDYSMTYQMSESRKRRSQYEYSPEDATMQDIKYHVCSEFVDNVFYEAFSDGNGTPYHIRGGNGKVAWVNLIYLADKRSGYYNSKIAVDYIENPSANPEKYREQILKELQPGDIIVYKYSKDGHVLLYLGEDKVINSSSISNGLRGGSYNYKEKVDNLDLKGTIGYVSLKEDVLNYRDEFSKYIFKNSVKKLAILRPLNEIVSEPSSIDQYRISDKTVNRMKHPKLVRTKTASVGKYENINIGEEITYTITLENKSNDLDYNNIEITDKIPSKTTFVSMTQNGINKDGSLKWNVDVPKGETVQISYTVKVEEDANILGTTIINNSTIVDGVNLNEIKTIINRTLTPERKAKIQQIKSRAGEAATSIEELLNNIYPEIEFPNTEELLSKIFDTNKIVLGNSDTNSSAVQQSGDTGEKDIFILKNKGDMPRKDQILLDMYVDGLLGGMYTITKNEPTQNDGRNTTYTKQTFQIGDILVLYDDDYEKDSYVAGEKNMYLYIGDNTFATVLDGKIKLIENENATKLIDSLLGQNCVIVLRPSNVIKEKIVDVPKLPDEEEENKQEEILGNIEKENDNTIANTIIPQAGKKDLIIIMITLMLIISIICYNKQKKLKNILK